MVANHKYIKQFSLLTHSAELDKKRFEETLHNRCASISEEYLRPFKECVEDVRTISLSRDDSALESYVQALRKAAAEADKEDIFSKTNLFSEPLFDCRDLSALEKLINAVVLLIENLEYQEIINSFVDRTNLIRLAIALMQRHAREKELNLRKSFLNEIIENIQSELSVKTAVVYKIFSGFPSSTVLTELSGETISRHDVLLDCLEAGEPAYIERRGVVPSSIRKYVFCVFRPIAYLPA